MNEIDRVFRVTFARWRRKLGHSNLESAWRRASNTMSGFIMFPTAAIVIPLSLVVTAMTRGGYSPAVKHTIQIVGVLVWLSISFLLDRRFQTFLIEPPQLDLEESVVDKRLLMSFRVTCIGSFIASCFGGWLLHRSGVSPI